MVGFTFPKNFVRIFLVVTNTIMMASGVTLLGFGLFKYFTIKNPNTAANEDPGTSIASGCIDIFIGACGLIGVLLKKRILLIINVVLLALAILTNILMIVLLSIGAKNAKADVIDNANDIITNKYGNRTDAELTDAVDFYQKTYECCGWSGRDGENLFLKSPWYKQNNGTRTLPDSCCLKASSECHQAQDVNAAKKSGFVQEKDCVDNIISTYMFFFALILIQSLLTTLLQIAVLTFCTICLLQEGGIFE